MQVSSKIGWPTCTGSFQILTVSLSNPTAYACFIHIIAWKSHRDIKCISCFVLRYFSNMQALFVRIFLWSLQIQWFLVTRGCYGHRSRCTGAKRRCANFVLEKCGYVNADAFGPHPLCRVKYLHFWEIKHLCSTWTSSASAEWLPPFICRYLIFLAFGHFFATRLIIFDRGWPKPRWEKSCWAKNYCVLIAGNHTSLRIGFEDGLLCEKILDLQVPQISRRCMYDMAVLQAEPCDWELVIGLLVLPFF